MLDVCSAYWITVIIVHILNILSHFHFNSNNKSHNYYILQVIKQRIKSWFS